MSYPCMQSRKLRSCEAEAPKPAGPCTCEAVLLSIVSRNPNPNRMRITTDPWTRTQAPPGFWNRLPEMPNPASDGKDFTQILNTICPGRERSVWPRAREVGWRPLAWGARI